MADRFIEAHKKYKEAFGKNFGLPFAAIGVNEWTEEDYIARMEKSVDEGMPFDSDHPDWPWKGYPGHLPDGAFV